MSFVRQSLPLSGGFDNPLLSKHDRILFEEGDYNDKHNKYKESVIQNHDKRIKKKELAHAEFIVQLIIDSRASSNKQRRRPSNTSSSQSFRIDNVLQDENNDWFFEKILEKFENIRSKTANRYARSSSNDSNNDVVYGVERVVERRYYVRKPKLVSKRDQLTSTSDLTRGYRKKNRQLSGVSSVSHTCSQCLSSTSSYVENLRDQSDSLRNEISELKGEIEQLQTSQQEFFQQLRTHFQSKTDSATTSQHFVPPIISPLRSPAEKNKTLGYLPVPLTTGKQSRSISTESHASSSVASSGTTTPTHESVIRPNAAKSSAFVAPTRQISEFMATKNPSIAPPPPPVNAYVSSKPPWVIPRQPVDGYIIAKRSSEGPTSAVNEHNSPKPPSVAPTSPVNEHNSPKPPSVAPTLPVNERNSPRPPSVAPTLPVDGRNSPKPSSVAPTLPVNGRNSPKPPSVAPTPPITEFTASKNSVVVSVPPIVVPIGPLSSRTSSVAPTPPTASSPVSSARIPIYENELAHRRVLSPRSQIVASSALIQDSSDSSSGSASPELIHSNRQKISKVPAETLRDNDLKDLVRYSSQLELSGFPPSVTPVITNPNTNSTFWESVDQYIENSRSTNINIGLPPIPRSNNENRFGLYNSTTKQLDKYDLEIKPQGIIESSAPLLMPPFDILP